MAIRCKRARGRSEWIYFALLIRCGFKQRGEDTAYPRSSSTRFRMLPMSQATLFSTRWFRVGFGSLVMRFVSRVPTCAFRT